MTERTKLCADIPHDVDNCFFAFFLLLPASVEEERDSRGWTKRTERQATPKRDPFSSTRENNHLANKYIQAMAVASQIVFVWLMLEARHVVRPRQSAAGLVDVRE